jgi:hypothetical protein
MCRTLRLVIPWLRALSCVLGLLPLTARIAAQDAATAPPAATATVPAAEAMEVFLQRAQIVSRRNAGSGVTDSVRATLSDGSLTHDAQIQTVDVSKPLFQAGKSSEVNFRDSYRYNIAGYRLARLLGMDNVPMSVQRVVEGKTAAMTWWIDDVLMTEGDRRKKGTSGPDPGRTTRQLVTMAVFDELIQNRDRNEGNILWTSDWKMWLIDHTRAFRTGTDLLKAAQLTRCDRALLLHLRGLTPQTLEAALPAGILTKLERDALLRRRDKIVKLFDERIASLGDATVLFDM